MTTWTLPNGEVVDYWPPSEPSDVDQIAARLDAVADRIAEIGGARRCENLSTSP